MQGKASTTVMLSDFPGGVVPHIHKATSWPPAKRGQKGRGPPCRKKTARKSCRKWGRSRQTLLERLMMEGRARYPEDHRPKGGAPGPGTSSPSMGRVEDVRVPRGREGEFHPAILPRRRSASLDGANAICGRYAAGVCTRAIFRFLDTQLKGVGKEAFGRFLKFNERRGARRLLGFAEVETGNRHAGRTHQARHYGGFARSAQSSLAYVARTWLILGLPLCPSASGSGLG